GVCRQHGYAFTQFSSIALPPAGSTPTQRAPYADSNPATTREPAVAPAAASRAALTPAAAAMPTWSDLPCDPKAARSPAALKTASRAAPSRAGPGSPSSRPAATAAPTAPQTAVGCQPRSYSAG